MQHDGPLKCLLKTMPVPRLHMALVCLQEGYGVMVLNPNENYREVEKPAKSFPKPSPTEPLDEPAEKRERREEKEGKRRREVYEKYRNPQKETEAERIPVRVSRGLTGGGKEAFRETWREKQKARCLSEGGKKRKEEKKKQTRGWTGVTAQGRARR